MELKNGGILLFDGAMGTYLAAKYEDSIARCELSNIQHPERVTQAHREYIAAGADAIKTNTFAANTHSMGTDLGDVFAVIDAGCRCAQAAAAKDTLIFASMGPILHDDQKKCDEERHNLIDRFLANGVSHFLFETFDEAPALIEAAQYVKSICPEAYVITECSVAPDMYTQSGISAQSIIDALCEIDEIDAYGFNCTCGPLHMVNVVQSIEFYEKPVCIMPNAGYPTVVGGRTVFKSTPDYFAEQLLKIAGAGVKILGGCCGTTPEHIRAAAQALRSFHAAGGAREKAPAHDHSPQKAKNRMCQVGNLSRSSSIRRSTRTARSSQRRRKTSLPRVRIISRSRTARSGGRVRTAVCLPLCSRRSTASRRCRT